jgi:hypothetical protein
MYSVLKYKFNGLCLFSYCWLYALEIYYAESFSITSITTTGLCIAI